MTWLFGWSGDNISAKDKAAAYSRLFSYTPTKMIVHWFQVMRAGRFQMYDDTMGLMNPGSLPPSLPINQISCPIVAFLGGKDNLCDEEYFLSRCGRRLVAQYIIPHYEHLDFIYARDAHEQVTPKILECLARLKSKPVN